MKKDLIEEIRRIHEITYNQTIINEGYIDSLLSKAKDAVALQKRDISSRADYINPDVQDFFNTLEKAAQTGLQPQKYGSMTYQKEVEALQIALVLLGYDLPKFGIDGLYGPETANAVNNFNNTISESVENLRSTLGSLGYSEKGAELTSGGQVGNEITDIVSKILTSFKEVDPKTIVTVTAGNDMFHNKMGGKSGHSRGQAIDLSLNPYSNRSARRLRKILDDYKSTDPNFNYIDEYSRPSRRSTGGHFHLEYGGSSISQPETQQSTPTSSKIGGAIATPQTINRMIDILKHKEITPDQIKQYVDPEVSSGGPSVTELDVMSEEGYAKYAEICDGFISKYSNPLNISGEMMAYSARRAFKRYGNYVPPELALGQLMLEGGINNNDPNSRPIKTRNPFNIGNTERNSKSYGDVQEGIDDYYRLIAGKYIGRGKTASNLLNDFVNKRGQRYASDVNYENKLASIAQKVNKISQSVKA